MPERLPDVGVNPDYGLTRRTANRVRRDGFGDGYEMRAPELINSRSISYTLKWGGLTESQADLLEDFFNGLANVYPFVWDQMKGVDIQLVGVSTLDRSFDEYDDYSVSIEVTQDFGMYL